MRLLAGVLHSDEIVWNSYTWDADAHKQINTNLISCGINTTCRKLEVTDYNEIKAPKYGNGFYIVASSTNCPFELNWTYLMLMSFNNISCIQLALGNANTLNPLLKLRTCVAGVWGDWI